MTSDDVHVRFAEFLNIWALSLPTTALFETSLRIRQDHSLSHWDSFLVAACREASVSRLYKEDIQSGAVYDGVEIVNPFE